MLACALAPPLNPALETMAPGFSVSGQNF